MHAVCCISSGYCGGLVDIVVGFVDGMRIVEGKVRPILQMIVPLFSIRNLEVRN